MLRNVYDDPSRSLRISALFRRDHLSQAREIEKRISSMLESWMIAETAVT